MNLWNQWDYFAERNSMKVTVLEWRPNVDEWSLPF